MYKHLPVHAALSPLIYGQVEKTPCYIQMQAKEAQIFNFVIIHHYRLRKGVQQKWLAAAYGGMCGNLKFTVNQLPWHDLQSINTSDNLGQDLSLQAVTFKHHMNRQWCCRLRLRWRRVTIGLDIEVCIHAFYFSSFPGVMTLGRTYVVTSSSIKWYWLVFCGRINRTKTLLKMQLKKKLLK